MGSQRVGQDLVTKQQQSNRDLKNSDLNPQALVLLLNKKFRSRQPRAEPKLVAYFCSLVCSK